LKYFMYNPIELSKKTEKIVSNGDLKKYYRFRPTGFYGGIATADTVGCNLRCAFCWSGNSVWNANNTGEFYSSKEIAENLQEIALKKGYRQLRISGGEPTIGRAHLIKLLEKIQTQYLFILETNGILLGNDETYIQDLSKFSNLHIRVCLKGSNAEEFTWLTGAEVGFEYQIKALELLNEHKMSFNIAVVTVKGNKDELFIKLENMGLGQIMIEEEEIKLYPLVKNRLKQKGIISYFV